MSKPKIAIFSGPRATIQNSAPLVTSAPLRDEHELPAAKAAQLNTVRAQRLAAPVKAYVQAYSGHPLERDASELYGAPDGYIDPKTGAFMKEHDGNGAIPVYEVEMRPEDGLYMLPYAARQADGAPWNGVYSTAMPGQGRQLFYPDASRIVEEIDRFGLGDQGQNNLLSSKADFDYYRPAPSGGYTKGLPATERTDRGEGDIAPEQIGVDFFCYAPSRQEPALPTLARLTNAVQAAMSSGEYEGAIWLEGSPTTEETIYWLGLLIDTGVPIIGNSSQHPHGVLGNDGDSNLTESVAYITSRIWAGPDGVDQVGTVMVQNGQIFASREVQKADARPGGYVAMGGHGGIIGNTVWEPVLSFLPVKRHTSTSELNLTKLPTRVLGTGRQDDGKLVPVDVLVKDTAGQLLTSALPKVTIARYVNYGADDFSDTADCEVEVLARIEKNLTSFPLAGIIAEGSSPYGGLNESLQAAMNMAVYRGMPVVCVGRGGGGFVSPTSNNRGLFIGGSNLTAPKARILLMAALLKYGSLPVPANPDAPTDPELDAIRARVREYQAVFDTH